MDNMYAHIEELCRLKGITITQMCRELGITRSALTELKNGRTQRLSIKYTKLILEYFNVDMTVFEHPLEDIQYAIGETKKDPSDADELMVILKNAELYEAVKNIASYELSKEELLKVVSFARFIKSESDSSL